MIDLFHTETRKFHTNFHTPKAEEQIKSKAIVIDLP